MNEDISKISKEEKTMAGDLEGELEGELEGQV